MHVSLRILSLDYFQIWVNLLVVPFLFAIDYISNIVYINTNGS